MVSRKVSALMELYKKEFGSEEWKEYWLNTVRLGIRDIEEEVAAINKHGGIFAPSEQILWGKLPNTFKWAEAIILAENRKGPLHRTLHKARNHNLLYQCPETRTYWKRSERPNDLS